MITIKDNDSFILIGLPAAGKSTMADFLKEKGVYVVSTDKIRKELTGSYEDQSKNQEVFEIAHARFGEAIRDKIPVVFDATSLNRRSRKALVDIARKNGANKIQYIWINTSLKECLARNAQRERHVPEEVILRMWEHMEPPTKGEGADSLITINEE